MSYPIRTAERVLNELGITCISDLNLLEKIAWARGALLRYKPLNGAEARLVAVGNPAIITISTDIKNPRRQRFSIAHEIGHFEMHRHNSYLNLCTKDKIDELGKGINKKGEDNNPEHEANLFASAFLLPERFFSPLCNIEDPSLEYISNIADQFNVSLTSCAIRYLHFSQEPLAIVFSQNNYIVWFHESKAFSEIREELGFFISVREKLDPLTLASFHFRNLRIPQGMRAINASAWFTPGRFSRTATIKENSITLPTYNAVLSLLWIDEIIDEDSYF